MIANLTEHIFKHRKTDTKQESEGIRKNITEEINEELESINDLLYMEFEDTLTLVDIYKLFNEKTLSQNKQRLNDKTEQPPIQNDMFAKEKATDTWQSKIVPYGIKNKVLELDGKTIHQSSSLKKTFLFLSENFPLEQSVGSLRTHFLNPKTKKPYGKRYCEITISKINGEYKKNREEKN